MVFGSLTGFAETYASNASWGSNSEMTLTEKNFFGLTTSVNWNVSTNRISVALGDQIKVYDKNNKLYKVFEVNVIAKDIIITELITPAVITTAILTTELITRI